MSSGTLNLILSVYPMHIADSDDVERTVFCLSQLSTTVEVTLYCSHPLTDGNDLLQCFSSIAQFCCTKHVSSICDISFLSPQFCSHKFFITWVLVQLPCLYRVLLALTVDICTSRAGSLNGMPYRQFLDWLKTIPSLFF